MDAPSNNGTSLLIDAEDTPFSTMEANGTMRRDSTCTASTHDLTAEATSTKLMPTLLSPEAHESVCQAKFAEQTAAEMREVLQWWQDTLSSSDRVLSKPQNLLMPHNSLVLDETEESSEGDSESTAAIHAHTALESEKPLEMQATVTSCPSIHLEKLDERSKSPILKEGSDMTCLTSISTMDEDSHTNTTLACTPVTERKLLDWKRLGSSALVKQQSVQVDALCKETEWQTQQCAALSMQLLRRLDQCENQRTDNPTTLSFGNRLRVLFYLQRCKASDRVYNHATYLLPAPLMQAWIRLSLCSSRSLRWLAVLVMLVFLLLSVTGILLHLKIHWTILIRFLNSNNNRKFVIHELSMTMIRPSLIPFVAPVCQDCCFENDMLPSSSTICQ